MRSKKVVTIAMVGLFGIFTIGCSKAPDFPKWWNNTDTRGYTTGRGVEKPNKVDDLNAQNNNAMLRAQTDLAGKVESTLLRLLSEKGDGGQTEAIKDSHLKSGTKSLLRGFKILKSTYTDDGRLWIQVGVKTSDIEKIIDKK